MKTTAVFVIAATLCGCSTFKDPSAPRGDVAECNVVGHKAAHEAPIGEVILIGPVLAHHFRAKDAFEECMAGKGYRS